MELFHDPNIYLIKVYTSRSRFHNSSQYNMNHQARESLRPFP